jgi:exopolyphosphatase/guanosine-5'-triphosphate,3'-diphosphate pyrophosphatase
MMMKYFAGIDIGTNTVLLLIISRNEHGEISVIHDEHRIARLGDGIHQTGCISTESIKRAQHILMDYASLIQSFPSITVRAIATSAMRDAQNREEVKKALELVLGYSIEIISGIEEAALTFMGSREDYQNPVIIDIGGGSTEIIQLNNDQEHCLSIDIGAVRLTDMHMKKLPLSKDNMDAAMLHIQHAIADVSIPSDATLIATAGTPTTLAAIDLQLEDLSSSRIHGHALSIERISELSSYLLSSTIDEIIDIPGVHPQRADILPAGAFILNHILNHVNAKQCIVSKKGLRYGIVQTIMN